MRDSDRVRLASAMRLSGRIIASLAATWFLAVIVGEVVSCDPGRFTWEGSTVVAVGAVSIAGAALSWHRERAGAIVLLVASVLIGLHIAAYADRWHLLVWMALGLPHLVAGLLLLGSLRLTRTTSIS